MINSNSQTNFIDRNKIYIEELNKKNIEKKNNQS